MPERFAIYYAPAAASPLWQRAAGWLGDTGTEVAGVPRTVLDPLTVSARRYGFHATIKAPMTLRAETTRNALETALAQFGATHRPVAIGPLRLAELEGFLALVPAVQSAELTAFAAEVVEAFEPFRAPLSAAERDRRVAGGRLSPRQVDLVDRYGYPYVLEQFQMHMTLTDRLPPDTLARIQAAAERHFAAEIGPAMVLDRLVLFHEPEPGAPFRRLGDFMLEDGA